MPVLQQLSDEPDDAFAAFRRYYEQQTHLETNPETLEKAYAELTHDWAETYDWDLRCEALDTELDRRRNIVNARLQQVAATNLLAVTTSALTLADKDNAASDEVAALAPLLDSISALVTVSTATLEANRLAPPPKTKPRAAKRATPPKPRTNPKTKTKAGSVGDSAVPDPQPDPEPAAKVAEPADTPRPPIPVLINPLDEPG